MGSAKLPGFVTYNNDNPAIPILLSVPHAGRDYPSAIFDNLRLPPEILVRLEDRYADILTRKAIAQGVPTIIATRARAWIDLNRDEQDIDVAMVDGINAADFPVPSAKQRGGLGLIPRRLAGAGDIWKNRLKADDLVQRIESFHRPYHKQLSDMLMAMRDRFGVALLLDLHSMPPVGDAAGAPPRFVIGDLFGKSASGSYSDLALAYFREHGFAADLNYPYSGDYILRRHAKPRGNIHAIQLEVDRSLYLDEFLREPTIAAERISGLIAELINALADATSGQQALIAAE
jgi:N-formylglutamate amidohydrolase